MSALSPCFMAMMLRFSLHNNVLSLFKGKPKDAEGEEQRFFSLLDVYNNTLRPKSYNMRWISGLPCTETPPLVITHDGILSYLLLKWIHSFFASYSLYDIAKNLQQVQFFDWSPVGHKLAYVWNNDVYVKTSPELDSERVTDSGKVNEIFNGIPDWSYEEEMFSSARGLWWSPGGKFVAYAQFNVSQVPHIEYPWFGNVRLFEHYLATVTWATDDRIAVQWLKRVQNTLILQIYSLTGTGWGHSEVRFAPSEPVFSADKNSYYLVMSDKQKYKHLHHGVVEPITSGKWEVIKISLMTDDSIYFVSNEFDGLPGGRNVYRYTYVQLATTYSKHFDYIFLLSPVGAEMTNNQCALRVTLLKNLSLENNKAFANHISKIQMPKMKRDLWYKMVLPPDFSESKKYPLLIDVYAGPCSQRVDYTYSLSWATYLASTEKIIVATFDGRGSGYQGDEIMHKLYKRLGTDEVEDQITATKEFIRWGFIDKDRVAIWGWSYGGYVTSMNSTATASERMKNFRNVQYLLVHGTADDNVHFQQSAEISEALVQEEVDFEAMWYTDKDHNIGGLANMHLYNHLSHFLLRCFA
uniref:Dipeptidyl-peptidase 4 n=1 Tax=Neogobius melanostomus TaxID=47308 RepID=A0A8C6WP08_9GOBI